MTARSNNDKNSPNIHFRFYWNDYLNDTVQLNHAQHGSYLACMLAYYRTGKPLPLDCSTVFRIVGAFTADEQKNVAFVLQNFFQKTDDCWKHRRIDEELVRIAESRAKSLKANSIRHHGTPDASPNGERTEVRTESARKSVDGPSSSSSSSKSNSKKQEQEQATDRQTDKETSQNEQSVSQSPVRSLEDSSSTKSKEKPLTPEQAERLARADERNAKLKADKARWKELTMDEDNDLPDSMRYALPTDEELDKLLAQIDEVGEDSFCEAVSEWESMQSPPISGLKFHRWRIWLETCAAKLNEYR
jgi:uncharacterized protein YdaU (DUF1376 family)